MEKSLKVTGIVEIFPLENPWVYIRVPKEYTEMFKDIAERGLVPITVTLGSSTWDTSLLPIGNGTQFIALKKAVRKKERIEVGDSIELSFILRNP